MKPTDTQTDSKQLEIVSLISANSELTHRLVQLTENLSDRLHGLCIPEQPCDPNCKAANSPQTEMGGAIHSINLRMNGALTVLESFLNRLQC